DLFGRFLFTCSHVGGIGRAPCPTRPHGPARTPPAGGSGTLAVHEQNPTARAGAFSVEWGRWRPNVIRNARVLPRGVHEPCGWGARPVRESCGGLSISTQLLCGHDLCARELRMVWHGRSPTGAGAPLRGSCRGPSAP